MEGEKVLPRKNLSDKNPGRQFSGEGGGEAGGLPHCFIPPPSKKCSQEKPAS